MRHEATLLHELPLLAAERSPQATALQDDESSVRYDELAGEIERFASALAALRVGRGERVAIYLDKRRETVSASFGAPAHGAVFVPVNPLLKAEQVAYILRDCGVRVLVTSSERLQALAQVLADCPELAHVIVVGSSAAPALPAAGSRCMPGTRRSTRRLAAATA
jgi:acyl-CoA synthetase (AMP-forming)/AMP-acid ligase II